MADQSDPEHRRPEVDFSADCKTLRLLPAGDRAEIMLVNLGQRRIAFKVRCSDNNYYRVNPVMAFVDSGQCHSLNIVRLPGKFPLFPKKRIEGPPKQDKIVIVYGPCGEADKEIREINNIIQRSHGQYENIRVLFEMIQDDEIPQVGPSPKNRAQ